MSVTSVRAHGELQLHLVDGRSVYPIEASQFKFARGIADSDGYVRHSAKHSVEWEADADRPSTPTEIEITVLENPDGEFVEVQASCSGWQRQKEQEFVLDANVISDGLIISQAPMEGGLA